MKLTSSTTSSNGTTMKTLSTANNKTNSPPKRKSILGKLFNRTNSSSTPITPPTSFIVDDEEFQTLQEENRIRQKQLIADSLLKKSHNNGSIEREKHISNSINSMKSLVQYLQEKFPEVGGETNLPGNEIVGPLISKEIRNQIKKGIPPSLRGPLWRFFIGNKLMLNRNLFQIYSNIAIPDAAKNGMTTDGPKRLNFDIDLERTFPALKFFQKGGPMYNSFVSVLECYVKMRPDVGYVQGMSYLVAMLLLYLEEYDAFLCLGNMIQNGCLYGLYKMDSVDALVQKFDKILAQIYPHLSQWVKKIRDEYNMNILQVVIVDWFFTLFSRSLPLDIAARLWDNYFLWSCCAYCKMGLKTNAQKISPTVSLTVLGGEWYLFCAAMGTLIYFEKTCDMLHMETEVSLYFLSHLSHYHTLTDVDDEEELTRSRSSTSLDDTSSSGSNSGNSRSNMETRVLKFLMETRKQAANGKLTGKDYELFDENILFACIESVQAKLTRKKFLKFCDTHQ